MGHVSIYIICLLSTGVASFFFFPLFAFLIMFISQSKSFICQAAFCDVLPFFQLMPNNLTTKMGGFYVNTGQLELREVSDAEEEEEEEGGSDGEDEDESSSSSSEMEEDNDNERAKGNNNSKKRRRPVIRDDDDDEDDDDDDDKGKSGDKSASETEAIRI